LCDSFFFPHPCGYPRMKDKQCWEVLSWNDEHQWKHLEVNHFQKESNPET
jgi:hypothetical protein